MSYPLKSQRGVVIVMALFMMALIASLAVAMMTRLDRDTYRTSLLIHAIQAELHAQGSIAWAIAVLNDGSETTVTESPVDKVNGYTIKGKITDLQGRFNLNTLKDENTQASFLRLMQAAIPDLNPEKAKGIVKATLDWIMPASKTTYDEYYATLANPYRAPHQPMVDPSELRLVKGMTADIYQALQPYITALPNTTAINVQTASVPVLMSLMPGLTLNAAKAIVEIRRGSPFKTISDFQNLDMVRNNKDAPKDKITIKSDYFLLETAVNIEKQSLLLYTVLHRVMTSGKASTRLIQQSKGIP